MSYEPLKRAFADVNVVVTTPFTGDGEAVAVDRLRENVRRLRDAGVELFIPCGGASEYYSLTDAEREAAVEATVDAVDGDGHVVAGVGGSAKEVGALLDRYEAVGADGAMLMFPDFPAVHAAGLRRYYRSILDGTDLGVMLYRSTPRLPTDVVVDLAEVENVVAVKYAVDDLAGFAAATESVPDDALTWVTGLAELYATGFAAVGAEGFTSGVANFVPSFSLSLQSALEDEAWERARRLESLVRPYQDLRAEAGHDNEVRGANGVAALKYGQELAGMYGGPVRPPSMDLGEEDRARARRYYERIRSGVD